jgi:hypothetical protein
VTAMRIDRVDRFFGTVMILGENFDVSAGRKIRRYLEFRKPHDADAEPAKLEQQVAMIRRDVFTSVISPCIRR